MNARGFPYTASKLFCLIHIVALSGVMAAKGDPMFYATEGTAYVDQISSDGVVTHYLLFPGSSVLPKGMAFGQNGLLYIADGGEGFLWRYPYQGGLNTWTSTGNQNYVEGLVPGNNGNYFAAIVGSQHGFIDQITPAGVVTTFANLPTTSEPYGLAFNSSGNLYAADAQLSKVYQITPNGTVSTFATIPGAGGLTGLAFGRNGDMFVAGFGGSIYEITPGGVVSTFATLGAGTGLRGLTFDNSGDLFVAEQYKNEVVEISPQGDVSNFAGMYAPQFLLLVPEPSSWCIFSLGTIVLVISLRRARPRTCSPQKSG